MELESVLLGRGGGEGGIITEYGPCKLHRNKQKLEKTALFISRAGPTVYRANDDNDDDDDDTANNNLWKSDTVCFVPI